MNHGLAVALAIALASSMLLVSGAGKIANSTPLRLALEELGCPKSVCGRNVVRGLGAAEILISIVLLVPTYRDIGGIGLALFGASLVGSGILGRVRRSERPCGCFGKGEGSSIGIMTIALGAVLTVLAIPIIGLERVAITIEMPAKTGDALPPLLTAIGALVISAVLWRRLIEDHLIRPFTHIVKPED